MRRCLQLAQHGELLTAPNPMVGAVLVADGRIIGEGWHRKCGEPHAEVNAFAAVRPADRHLIPEATLYVSLEPCAHYGRTPPCAELIIRKGVRRVVVGCVDPFARVAGRGIEMLRQAGIEVVVGVLREACLALNKRFICQHALHRPFITLKWAASADGFLDRIRPADEEPSRLSSPLSKLRVHKLRALHGAILVGHRTFVMDRPHLRTHYWPGNSPLRCVLGSVGEEALAAGFEAFADIDTLLATLTERGIQGLFVEGGERTLQSFIERDLWDEAWQECTPVLLGDGVPVPTMPRQYRAQDEMHYGARYKHWVSPILASHYVDFS